MILEIISRQKSMTLKQKAMISDDVEMNEDETLEDKRQRVIDKFKNKPE